MLENLELYLDAIDQQDSRDYSYEKLYMDEYGMGTKPNQIRDKEYMKIRDQFDQKSTYKACTCYSLTGIYNGNNVAEYLEKDLAFIQENPMYKWHVYQNTRGRPNTGSTLQNLMKFFIANNWIEGYMRADTIEGVKNALDNGFLIYTGSNSFDWRKTGASGVAELGNGGGHAFFICGYNNKGFLCPNSFGTDRGDDGYFTVPYEYFDKMYSKNVIVDKDDTGLIENLNYDREYKKAVELGITNGSNPDKPATKKEVAVMVYRSLAIK